MEDEKGKGGFVPFVTCCVRPAGGAILIRVPGLRLFIARSIAKCFGGCNSSIFSCAEDGGNCSVVIDFHSLLRCAELPLVGARINFSLRVFYLVALMAHNFCFDYAEAEQRESWSGICITADLWQGLILTTKAMNSWNKLPLQFFLQASLFIGGD